jgi:hypothetical protein
MGGHTLVIATEGRDGIQALREAAVHEGHTWQYLRWVLIIRVLTSLSLSLKVKEISHNPKKPKSILRLSSFYRVEDFFNRTLM